MIIGILTQPLRSNYGGILQNYALQTVLLRLGHHPVTLDLSTATTKRNWCIAFCKTIVKKALFRKCEFPKTQKELDDSSRPLRLFTDTHIYKTTPPMKPMSMKLVREYGLQGIIVGSDQVWRPMYNYCIQDMFLRFAKGTDIRKVAYAASFGTEEWEYTKEQEHDCKQLAKQFDAISVREASGVKLCHDYLDATAVHVLDPTLLLSRNDYEDVCESIPIKKEKFAFVYLLDPTDETLAQIKAFASKRNLDILIKSANTGVQHDDSIEKWIAYFRDAECVITDSFHGSIFSIIFNKEFYVLGNKGRGQSRFASLLHMSGLEDRLVSDGRFTESSIEWSDVNNKVNSHKDMSLDWLRSKLV